MTRNFNTFIVAAVAAMAFFICLLCSKSYAQNFKTIHPGIEHAQVDHKIAGDPVKINLLRLDLTKVRLDVHHALDKAIGVEPTSSIAARHKGVAAINAGFFRLDTSKFAGDSVGVFAVDGQIWSESHNDRAAIRIRNGKEKSDVSFVHLRAVTALSYSTGMTRILSGVNRERKAAEMIVYTPEFGDRTLTDPAGSEVVFTNCNARSRCRIRIVEKGGNSLIPRDGFVISIGPDQDDEARSLLAYMTRAQTGPTIRVKVLSRIAAYGLELSLNLKPTDDITNGVPLLIRNGRIDITWEQEKASRSFVEMRHPRTAVAKLRDEKFLMITVDGRQPGVSVGMTLRELADYLLSIGATDAMNLDGGGSTTMFVNGKVINTPSDKTGERKVSDAIVVTLRKNARR